MSQSVKIWDWLKYQTCTTYPSGSFILNWWTTGYPPYFNFMIPSLPRVCDHYTIRRPTFHLPHIVHEFAQQLVEYQMIKLLNQPDAHIYTVKVQTHSFEGFKHFIKRRIIESYRDHCSIPNCDSCTLMIRRNNERAILRQ